MSACPSEERIEESHFLKLDKYTPLVAKCESKEWRCHNLAIEVGARGMVSRWFHLAMSNIGIKGRALSRVKNDASKESVFCSSWIHKLSSRKEWKRRL